MPDGINVLYSIIDVPESNKAQAATLVLVGVCILVITGMVIYSLCDSRTHIIPHLLGIVAGLVIIAFLVICIVDLLNVQEQTYYITIADNYPAAKLYEQFDVRKVEGLIYTVVPKN